MNVGDGIRKAREQYGITQTELARRLGISSRTVSSWEVNRTEPKMGMIERICEVLHCRKSDLIGETARQPTNCGTLGERYLEELRMFRALSAESQASVAKMVRFLYAEEQGGGRDESKSLKEA